MNIVAIILNTTLVRIFKDFPQEEFNIMDSNVVMLIACFPPFMFYLKKVPRKDI